MAYLKALGILRLVGEQKDPEARGSWQQDAFRLRSRLDRDALLDFFLKEYRPTPILGPWAGGSGFFPGDNDSAVNEIANSASQRFSAYRETIAAVRRILAEERITTKPARAVKGDLLRRYRRELPDAMVAWMDAAMVLQESGQGFAPLLGSGGNDGRLDFTQNFMQRLIALRLHGGSPPSPESRSWLETALFGSPSKLDVASVGQFAPGRAGGPNATQGMEGDALDNPWDFVLMMEGTLLLAGAAARRFGVSGSSRPTFPFTVEAVSAGFHSAGTEDAKSARGETWLPLWDRFATVSEVRQLFGEGRAEVSGQPVRDGADFARAVASLGVDRGIAAFTRVAFLRRSGKAYLGTPLGRFDVVRREGVDLLREIDPWLRGLRQVAADKDSPPRFARSVRRIESAIFDFCKYGGNRFFQEILVALGLAERELAGAEGSRPKKEKKNSSKSPRPLGGLSAEWIDFADDGSSEFAIAKALAFIHDAEARIDPLRANLEPVIPVFEKTRGRQAAKWAERQRAVVWNAADLSANLAQVLERRMMDGGRAGCTALPLAARFAAPLNAIGEFLEAEVDDRRIEELIWGLMLVDPDQRAGPPDAYQSSASTNTVARERRGTGSEPTVLIPRRYALLKLLFLPAPLVPERSADRVVWRLARRMADGRCETGISIRPEPRVLHLLRSGQMGLACRIAVQRLRVSGLPPMPGPGPAGGSRDAVWLEETLDPRNGRRLAAALLIPIDCFAVGFLVDLVTRDSTLAAEAVSAISEGEFA